MNIDRHDTALVLIGHQVGTMQLIKNLPAKTVLENVLALAEAAKILDLPVVLTSSQEQNIQGGLAPELVGLFPQERKMRVQRQGIVYAWYDKKFVEAIEATGKKSLIMCGVTTDICLLYPSISAVREGYKVHAELANNWSTVEGQKLIQLLFSRVLPAVERVS